MKVVTLPGGHQCEVYTATDDDADALMAEYEAGLVHERTQAGLVAARSRGHKCGRKPKMTTGLTPVWAACGTPSSR